MHFIRLPPTSWHMTNAGLSGTPGSDARDRLSSLCPVRSLASVIVPCGLGGWTDGRSILLPVVQPIRQWEPGCRSAPVQWEQRGLGSDRELGCSICVRRTTTSSECTGWMDVGDGNVTQLFPLSWSYRCSNEHRWGPALTHTPLTGSLWRKSPGSFFNG